MTQTPYAFDSANYALAVRDFYNVVFHQPHPPGYPLYVAFAKVIDLVARDANRSLVLEGILWSALAVGMTTLLARAMFGRGVGLLAGTLLLLTVGFWGYGEVAYPYVALAGETATLAWLAYRVLSGRRAQIVWFGLAWGICAGVRWDAAVFSLPLWLWALWAAGTWRLRLASVGVAAAVVIAWAVPMIALSGGWDSYLQALTAYMQVWSPQSAFVIGAFATGGDTQASYNLNFLVNYLRQMLGVGLLLIPYLLGRRFGPANLAADQRSRFLAVWVVPPLLVYVFSHLGEPGYVLSLAPQSAMLIAVAIADLRTDSDRGADVLRQRGWRWLPAAHRVGTVVAAMLVVGVVGWNVQAFLRGVGPGRLPDLRARDATTAAQIEFVRQQPPASTLVLAHDIVRQLAYARVAVNVGLLYSEYVPDFERARTRTDLSPATEQVVVLDSPLQVPSDDAARVREIVLREQPRVSVWVIDTRNARAIEHGYRFADVLGE
jgi:4-amino-4-deoxy-L-arabinose transferase-like glycosyltransferase